ncbi:MAG: hypothetical protein WCH39_20800 [Schlesneria sp.]
MTIRFTCAECASVLKIKDELAGTSGRCPKCKTKFVVPTSDFENEFVPERGDATSNQPIPGSTGGTLTGDDRLSDHGPDKRATASEHVKNDVSRSTVIPQESSSSETLRLDDGDEESNANTDSSASNGVLQPTTDGDAENSAEDDLDCPPMLVLPQRTNARSVTSPQQSFRSEKSSFAADKEFFSTQPTVKLAPVIEAFDPSKFTVTDPPVVKPEREIASAHVRDEIPELSLSDDSDIDLEDRPEPGPISRPAPVVPATRTPPEKVDLATAAKMMKKAIRDNQAAESQQREIDANAGFDFAGFFREFGLKGLGILVGGALFTLLLYFMSDRMFGSKHHLPKMGYVSGVVKLNGQPLPGATVYFSPEEVTMEGQKRERIRTSTGVTDANGNFRMMYIPADRVEGVAVGRCRVWVDHMGPTGRSDVPPEWMEAALQIKEVTPGRQPAPLEIDMKSKTR